MKIWLLRADWFKSKDKKAWKWGAALSLLLLLVYASCFFIAELKRLPPAEEVRQGLVKTINAKSYRYSSETKRIYNREATLISEIKGEKALTSVHIEGNIPLINAKIEVYRVEDTMYRRDSLTANWVVVPIASQSAVEQLIAEVNPLAVFDFTAEIDVSCTGSERVQGRACRVYEVMKRGESKYLELYWTDYTFRVWIDKRDALIRKAEVRAEHRDNSLYLLEMTVLFWDYNEPISITRPATS